MKNIIKEKSFDDALLIEGSMYTVGTNDGIQFKKVAFLGTRLYHGRPIMVFVTKEDKQIHFEEAFKRLEKIVGNLESGDLSLEESIKLFEEGIGLTEACKTRLDDAEKKIQLLLKNSDGKLSLEDKD